MMNNMANKNLITREKYKEIKKYDRQQMEEFLAKIYEEGFKEGVQQGKILQASTSNKEQEWFEKGVAETQAMFKAVIDQALDCTKGIGEKTKILFTQNFNRLALDHCEKILGVGVDEQ